MSATAAARSGRGVHPLRSLALLVTAAAAVAAVILGCRLLLVAPLPMEPPAERAVRCLREPAVAGEPARVSALTLVTCPLDYDGVRVAVSGEVVGLVLTRGERAWLQLNDDGYAAAGPLAAHRLPLGRNHFVMVSVPRAIAEQIDFVGGHRTIGDQLAVEGTYAAADTADGGAPAITADVARLLGNGQAFTPRPAVAQRWTALALAVLTGAAALHVRRRRLAR